MKGSFLSSGAVKYVKLTEGSAFEELTEVRD